jgi:hypothetical protein
MSPIIMPQMLLCIVWASASVWQNTSLNDAVKLAARPPMPVISACCQLQFSTAGHA